MIGRLPIAKMLAATVALTAAISAVMLSINWDGQEASTAAPKIDDLLNVMIVLSSFVFSLVMVMLFYALWKFRAKPGDESDGEPIHGNTRLEVAWTLIPTIIVLFGAGYSWSSSTTSRAKAADPLHGRRLLPAVRVELRLPGQGRRLVAGRAARPGRPPGPVQDARPGRDPLLLGARVADQERQRAGDHDDRDRHPGQVGTYQLICTELCGFGHATMRAKVVVEPPAEFRKWVAGLKEKVPAAADGVDRPGHRRPTRCRSGAGGA